MKELYVEIVELFQNFNNQLIYNKLKTKGIKRTFLQIQHSIGPTISHTNRYKLYKLFNKKQIRFNAIDDGLHVCKMYPVHKRLCNG